MPALSIASTAARSTTQIAIAVANELLELLLERLGRAAADERLSRREQNAGAGETEGRHWVAEW